MKYVILLVILVSLGTGIYYELIDYKNLSLITNHWEIPKEEITQGYSLINMEGESLKFYQFTTANGFIDIVKQLWLILVLAVLSVSVVLPFSIYVLKAFWNVEISEAIETKKQAKKSVEKYQSECNLKVKDAYDKQMKIVQSELSKRLDEVEKRENVITEREAIANKKTAEAETALVQYQKEFLSLKSDFERKEAELTKQRDNAITTMNVRRMKFEKKEKMLKKKLQCNLT